ncbi:TetR/AcrR family transcriptional regulator [Halioxenophilus sp. WMMB6]|uniref:TetR/AcrR family transcriptional regulator n=1 Tax=Halioxenophilus sp. WMMB6 TaxID=3073815 RepID=UPI00295E9A54|nr:TetR/AcrR family transcriptional regulator [Halioxenophilus sp. WMMB6]
MTSPTVLPPSKAKANSRERLLAAATECFLNTGYIEASVEEIAKAAGVSRMTFYRHFTGKVDLSVALFQQAVNKAKPRFLQITELDFNNLAEIKRWLTAQFEIDKENRSLLRVFSQATAEGAGFTEKAQATISDYITALGEKIPAFRLQPDAKESRRRWLEAWLLIYEILDQSNHAALESGIATDPIVIDILAEKFLTFITTQPQ